MTDPIRAALKRLLSAVLEGLGQDDHPMGWAHVDDAIDAARAALAAEPVAEGPTDEELDRLERQHWEETGVEEQGQRETLFNHRSFARAALARYGHQPAPPAAGASRGDP